MISNQELHNGEVWAEGDPHEIKGITKQYVLDLIAEIKRLRAENQQLERYKQIYIDYGY